MSGDPLAAVVDEVARSLPPSSTAALAAVLDRFDRPATAARLQAVSAVPTSTFATEAGRLIDTWSRHRPELAGVALALALRAAARTAESLRAAQTIDVVWTGPTTPHVPVRLTRAVLLEVIRTAERHLILTSFAAYGVQPVLDALAAALGRGVDIRLILESSVESGGALTVDAARAFSSLEGVSFYVWPAEKRPVLERGVATLHAKAAIADDRAALVTSANLTAHAIAQNMELGLLVRGGPVPRRLRDHFDELIARGVLVQLPS